MLMRSILLYHLLRSLWVPGLIKIWREIHSYSIIFSVQIERKNNPAQEQSFLESFKLFDFMRVLGDYAVWHFSLEKWVI